MKLSKLFTFIIFISVLCVACSKQEITVDSKTNEDSGNYFPNALNSFWKYDVNTTTNNETENTAVNRDSLYIKSQNSSSFTLGVNDTLPASGTMNNLLTNGTLTNNNNTLVFNGRLELPEIVGEFEPLTLENFILYDTESIINTELATKSGIITQDLEGIPLTINYTVNTIANGIMDAIDINETTYSNVISTKLVIKLKITATVNVAGISLPINILDEQDILVNTYLFAQDIGLIHATSEFNYQISNTAIAALNVAEIELPIPVTGTATNTEVLTNYFIGE